MKRLARWLRRLADRLDHDGALRELPWSFTWEHGHGAVFRTDGKGCRLLCAEAAYRQAYAEADRKGPWAPREAPAVSLHHAPTITMRKQGAARV